MGGLKEGKIPDPTPCDETTEMDATITFAPSQGVLPFTYPSQYNGCGPFGPTYSPHLNYNSVTSEGNLNSYGQDNYFCVILVSSACPNGINSTYFRQYLWKAGSSMQIKILKNTNVSIDIKYIEPLSNCNGTGSAKRVKWTGSYNNMVEQ